MPGGIVPGSREPPAGVRLAMAPGLDSPAVATHPRTFFRSSWGRAAQPGVFIHGHMTPGSWCWRESLAPLPGECSLEGPGLLDNGPLPGYLLGYS